ncbi:MAG: ABC transporter ATP-binding protein [Proteobacteria bacterium]|nr:ABC transporter ATP-binding protein [Pseudomonadota bacterium]MBU1717156.1 ABC transporter ATP-binding protein [Pseudomonadota bacterium]
MLLKLKNLNTSFHTDEGLSRVLHDVSFQIAPGQTMALVGESGSGKSVTALSILRLLEREKVETSGEIIFEDQDLNQLSEPEMRRVRGNRIAMIFQEPMTSLNPVYTVGSQLMESLIIHQQMAKSEARKRAIELMERSGIPEPAHRIDSFPHQLSGGQRQRVMIAMALACRPSLLIADEPTTALDVTIQAQILELIRDVQREMGMALLLITHDLVMVRKIADQVQIMHQGRIVEHNQTEAIFTSPQDPYTKILLESVPADRPAPKEKTAPLLEISNLQCHFAIKKGFFKKEVGLVKAVDSVSLQIRQGTTFGLVGESGSGKSTLGICLLRLIGCHGEIIYQGRNLMSLSSREMRPLRQDLQLVFQDPFSSLSPRLTVEQIVGEGLQVHKIGGNRLERQKLVAQALLDVGLTKEMADRYPHEFSGGQRQRIAIARALVLNPKFMVLDEPTSALDVTIQAQIIKLLRDLQKKYGMTYLFISHDLRTIRAMADEVAVMHQGKIVETGSTEIFDNPQHPYTMRLFAAAFGTD